MCGCLVVGFGKWPFLVTFIFADIGSWWVRNVQKYEDLTQRFLKSTKNIFFSAQNVLDPLLSLYMYQFIPKVLLKDQKMRNLRRIKKYERFWYTFKNIGC